MKGGWITTASPGLRTAPGRGPKHYPRPSSLERGGECHAGERAADLADTLVADHHVVARFAPSRDSNRSSDNELTSLERL